MCYRCQGAPADDPAALEEWVQKNQYGYAGPKKFKIKDSGVGNGKGLFAAVAISKGTTTVKNFPLGFEVSSLGVRRVS